MWTDIHFVPFAHMFKVIEIWSVSVLKYSGYQSVCAESDGSPGGGTKPY